MGNMKKIGLSFGLLVLLCWMQAAMSAVPVQPQAGAVAAQSSENAAPSKTQATKKRFLETFRAQDDLSSPDLNFSLLQLGVASPLNLVGGDAINSVQFSFNVVRLIKSLRLKLHYSYSPLLNPANSLLKVELNGHEVTILNLPKGGDKDAEAIIDLDPVLLQEWNQLTFHFTGHLVEPFCDNPRSLKNWLQIDNETSFIESSSDRLPVAKSMSLLPTQFFDKHDVHDQSMAFVLPNNPSVEVLQSAGVVASWFGSLAEWRKIKFSSYMNTLPDRSAVVLATASDVIDGVTLPPVTGKLATVTIAPHPSNPNAYLLLVVGRDSKSLVEAVRILVSSKNRPEGAVWDIQSEKIAARKPFDAPGWLAEDKVIRLDEILPKDAFRSSSLMARPLDMTLHLPPDLHRSLLTKVPLNLEFESSNGSRYLRQVDAYINEYLFQSKIYDMPGNGDPALIKHKLRINIPSDRLTGKDFISIRFTFVDKEMKACETAFVKDVINIDPGSTIDLDGQPRRVSLPDLRYLAYNGFPYSKMADLSETVVLLPETPDHNEIDSMLMLLGHIGNKSGYPGTDVTIASIKQADKFADKDILVVGTLTGLRPLLEKWADSIQVNLLGKEQPSPKLDFNILERMMHWGEQSVLFNGIRGEEAMVVVGFESPLQSKRSVVMLTARDSSNLVTEAETINTLQRAQDFNGDVAVITREGEFSTLMAFDWGSNYTQGGLSLWQWIYENKTHSPYLAAWIVLLMTVLFAAQTYYIFRRKADKRLGKVTT